MVEGEGGLSMEDGKCPCKQHTDDKPLPEDRTKVCVYWDLENNRCNIALGYVTKKGPINDR